MNRKEHGSAAGILLVTMTIGFIASSAFAGWAFAALQDSKNNLDTDVNAATAVAVQEAVSAKEAELLKAAEYPFRPYQGTETYGSLRFEFPKSWNVYRVGSGNTILDLYAHPREIPGISAGVKYSLRAQILNSRYTTEVAKFEKAVDAGDVLVRAFEPELVPSEDGVYISGEIVSGKQGAMVILPQRDKTYMLWTESTDYLDEFNEVIKTINFTP